MAAIAVKDNAKVPARLAIAWLTLFVIGTNLFVISPLLPMIAGHYGVSPSSAGISAAGFALGYLLSALSFERIAADIGRRNLLTCSLIGLGVADLMIATAGTFSGFVAAWVLTGCMAAAATPAVYARVGDRAVIGARGAWLAIAASMLLGAPLGAAVGEHFGWPVVFIALAASSLALGWANHRCAVVASPAPVDAEVSPQGAIATAS